MKTVQKAVQRIAEAENILIICHVSPDGDAIGSLLGLGLALQREKNITLACTDPVPEMYCYLPYWETITQTPRGCFDLVVSLDCSDLDRLGSAYNAQELSGVPIVNIDHHTTNVGFGEINWIEPQAAATSQILVRLIRALDIRLSTDAATCLLNGILTDTQGFRTSNTTPEVMETATQLMTAGASLSELTDQIFNHRPLATIRMWAMALQDLHLEERVLWSEITQSMRRRVGYRENGDAGLVNLLNKADEADIAVVFDELHDGQINVSMRAVPGYDVSQVALSLGGGGHAQAAGCTLPGPLESARATVLSMLREAWDTQTPHK